MTVVDEAVAIEPATFDDFASDRLPRDRLLPQLICESPGTQWLWVGMILIVSGLYAATLFRLWAPADGGIDQNAYLVGGRMISEHFTTRYTPPTPYAYIGGMFDRSTNGSFYPKYPFGLPLLYACCLWIFGQSHGVAAALAVSPICTVAATLGMFFLARLAAGSFPAICAAILLACSQVTMLLANNPNSHASCLAFIVWGMYLLIRWWQSGKIWVGILAGLLLGYAALIRYSEGLLVLPIAVAAMFRLRWKDWRSYLRSAAPGLAWAVPIASLFIYNRITLGQWTGYDSTNESEFGSAFTWAKFTETWEEMLRTLHDMGMFFTLPLGVAGLAMLFRRNWRLALVMLSWVLPGIALYTSYYWSPDRGVAYARFFLTFFPGLFVGVAVCFNDGILHAKVGAREAGEHPLLSIPLDLAVGVIVCIAAGVGVYRSINGLESGSNNAQSDLVEQLRLRTNLATVGDHLVQRVPPGSVLFAEEGGMGESPINYLQFLRPWDVYSVSAFSPTGGRRGIRFGPGGFGGGGPNGGPNGGAGGGFFGGGGPPGGPGDGGGFGGGFGGRFGGRGGANGGGLAGGNTANQNNADPQQLPSPMQPALREYFAELYKTKTPDDLIVQEKLVIDGALHDGKRVFVVAAEAQISSFESALKPHAQTRVASTTSNAEKSYTFKTLSHWKDLEAPPDENPAFSTGFGGQRRGGDGGGDGGGGGGGNFNNRNNQFRGPRAVDIAWQLVEVKSNS